MDNPTTVSLELPWIVLRPNDKAIPHAVRQGNQQKRKEALSEYESKIQKFLTPISHSIKKETKFWLAQMKETEPGAITQQLGAAKFFSGWHKVSAFTNTSTEEILKTLEKHIVTFHNSSVPDGFRLYLETIVPADSKNLYTFLSENLTTKFSLPFLKKVSEKTLEIRVDVGISSAYLSLGPLHHVVPLTEEKSKLTVGSTIIQARFGEGKNSVLFFLLSKPLNLIFFLNFFHSFLFLFFYFFSPTIFISLFLNFFPYLSFFSFS